MRVLVTGGAGFIGSAVIRYIINNTTHSVVNVDNLTYAGNLESLTEINKSNRYTFEYVDITNQCAITDVLEKYNPNAIMHLAAESHVDRSIDKPDSFIQTNIVGTYVLLEAARLYWQKQSLKFQHDFRFHHVSTDEVYGDLHDTEGLFTEDSVYAPSSPYSASKAASDHLVRAWHRTYSMPVLISNCSNNYGSNQFPEKLIPHIIINALNGDSLPIYGNGNQIRDWLYVDDHAVALVKVISDGKVGETYNIGGNNELTNLSVVEMICQILEELVPELKKNGVKQYTDLIKFVEDRPGHDARYAIDATKIERELNWKPQETFETGLLKTVKWYLENELWWKNVLSGDYRLERIGCDKKIKEHDLK